MHTVLLDSTIPLYDCRSDYHTTFWFSFDLNCCILNQVTLLFQLCLLLVFLLTECLILHCVIMSNECIASRQCVFRRLMKRKASFTVYNYITRSLLLWLWFLYLLEGPLQLCNSHNYPPLPIAVRSGIYKILLDSLTHLLCIIRLWLCLCFWLREIQCAVLLFQLQMESSE